MVKLNFTPQAFTLGTGGRQDPVNYEALTQKERRKVREQYVLAIRKVAAGIVKARFRSSQKNPWRSIWGCFLRDL